MGYMCNNPNGWSVPGGIDTLGYFHTLVNFSKLSVILRKLLSVLGMPSQNFLSQGRQIALSSMGRGTLVKWNGPITAVILHDLFLLFRQDVMTP